MTDEPFLVENTYFIVKIILSLFKASLEITLEIIYNYFTRIVIIDE